VVDVTSNFALAIKNAQKHFDGQESAIYCAGRLHTHWCRNNLDNIIRDLNSTTLRNVDGDFNTVRVSK